ncbi:MAG: peptide chain release factor 3 [Verrucomicrobia bacterium]|nr:peptide chain release factor 3 [Verrucomicrobiota bacterium]
MSPAEEIQRRRTFAIISHPDAGKTTLTEKLLLYGGAVQLAGSVTARKSQRAATSDWMELERKRGISITSTVLQFDYRGFRINLLDTPGHRDFSEDTYRVLTAVDAVIMVIDAGKGIEAQTRKLFEVCRQRGVPIFTFMNKLDRPTKDPLELLDELERVLGIGAYPVNWPLGTGFEFRGVYDRQAKQVHLFEKIPGGGQYMPPVNVTGLDAPLVREKLDESSYARTFEELEMLEIAGVEYREEEVQAGRQTPVFFGSAMNNFGVQLLLDAFVERAAPPGPRTAGEAGLIEPARPDFSGFIFKIQANMDPRHRDRIAFLRVCSGRFDRDMQVVHSRTKKKVRLSNAHRLFAKDRETIEEAWPGDIVGLVGYHDFGIGDTLSEDGGVVFHEIPRFPPECFAFLHNPNTAKFKQFRQGLDQLLQEGVVQLFHIVGSLTKTPLLAAVGPLQFEVVQYRLETEYGAESRLENASWEAARWLPPDVELSKLKLPTGVSAAEDSNGGIALLFPSDWTQRYFRETNPGVELRELA